MRGAGIGARRHRRKVRCHQDEQSRRGGPRPGRCDVNGNRHWRREDGLIDRAHRGVQPAGRVELDDDETRVLLVRIAEGALDVTRDRRVDDAANFEEVNGARARLRVQRVNPQREQSQQPKEQKTPAAHTLFPLGSTTTSSDPSTLSTAQATLPSRVRSKLRSTCASPTRSWLT